MGYNDQRRAEGAERIVVTRCAAAGGGGGGAAVEVEVEVEAGNPGSSRQDQAIIAMIITALRVLSIEIGTVINGTFFSFLSTSFDNSRTVLIAEIQFVGSFLIIQWLLCSVIAKKSVVTPYTAP